MLCGQWWIFRKGFPHRECYSQSILDWQFGVYGNGNINIGGKVAKIISKINSKEYDENYDKIFQKEKKNETSKN